MSRFLGPASVKSGIFKGFAFLSTVYSFLFSFQPPSVPFFSFLGPIRISPSFSLCYTPLFIDHSDQTAAVCPVEDKCLFSLHSHCFSGSRINHIVASCPSAESLHPFRHIQRLSPCSNHEHFSHRETFAQFCPLSRVPIKFLSHSLRTNSHKSFLVCPSYNCNQIAVNYSIQNSCNSFFRFINSDVDLGPVCHSV